MSATILNSETGGRFQVGRPRDLRDDDPWFADEYAAVAKAGEMASTEPNQVFAVWDDHGACLHLWFDGEHFRRT